MKEIKEIKITLSLPIVVDEDYSSMYTDAYVDGYTRATLEPILSDIDEGVLNVDRMLAAGWQIDIPERAEPIQVFTGGIGGPLVSGLALRDYDLDPSAHGG